MRLFTMALVTSVILLPYSFFVLYQLAINIVDDYSWSKVHGHQWNSVVKVPSYGAARWDRWGEVATGYVMFLCFGTGSDANNTYKHMLTSIGLGKFFPSLYIMSESRNARSPSNVTFGRRLTSSFSTKAKSLFSKNDSISGPSHNESIVAPTAQPTSASASVTKPILSQQQLGKKFYSKLPSFFRHMFSRTDQQSILPLHGGSSIQVDSLPPLDRTSSDPTVFTAHAWAADNASIEKNNENPGVYVVHEVHQASQDKSKQQLDNDAWV
jgi:pheromone a factor receptor